MEVKTLNMGVVEVSEKQIIDFPEGLFGFEDSRKYALIEAEQKPFVWMQSIENEHISFLLINPFLFRGDYELDIDEKDQKLIDLDNPGNALIFAIVTFLGDGSPITANLQGPVVINTKNNLAVQAVLSDPRWLTKHDIMAELKQGSE